MYLYDHKALAKPPDWTILSRKPLAKPPDWTRVARKAPANFTFPLDGKPGDTRRGADIPHNIESVHNMWLVVTMTRDNPDTEYSYPAEAYVKRATVTIGNFVADALHEGWLRMYDELVRPLDGQYQRTAHFAHGQTTKTFYVPLPFWFRDGVRPLHMIALYNHAVRCNFEFGRLPPGLTVHLTELAVQGVLFGTCARAGLFQPGIGEHVIQQIQADRIGVRGKKTRMRLNLSGAVRYLALDVRHHSSGTGVNLEHLALEVDGKTLCSKPGSFFQEVQPYNVFGRVPSRGRHVMPFCFDPLDIHHASGSLNFSRYDCVILEITPPDGVVCVVDIYAPTYNVFRWCSGLAGTAWNTNLNAAYMHPFDFAPEATRIQTIWRGALARIRYAQRLHEKYAPGGDGAEAALDRLRVASVTL